MLRDGYSNFKFFDALSPVIGDAANGLAITGIAVDRQGYDTVTFVVDIGLCESMTTAGSWHVLKLEHYCSVNLAWSEVDPSQMLHSVVGMDGAYSTLAANPSGIFQSLAHSEAGSTTYFVGYRGNRRLTRVVLSGTLNSGTSINIGVVAVLGLPSNWPVNSPV